MKKKIKWWKIRRIGIPSFNQYIDKAAHETI